MREERTTNYYTLLELLPTATDADIKKAWHEQIQVWHPDRFNHSPTLHRKAEARTQLINQAYQTLSDPSRTHQLRCQNTTLGLPQATRTPRPCIRPIFRIVRLPSATSATSPAIPAGPSRAPIAS